MLFFPVSICKKRVFLIIVLQEAERRGAKNTDSVDSGGTEITDVMISARPPSHPAVKKRKRKPHTHTSRTGDVAEVQPLQWREMDCGIGERRGFPFTKTRSAFTSS